MAERSLLMIPGPVEVSPAVLAAFSSPPPGHTAPALIAAFGEALESMRRVWLAEPSSQPFVVGGGGTAAMDMAVANLVSPGDRVVVVKTGYFSDRMAEMLRRQGAATLEIGAEPGDAPSSEEVREALTAERAAGAPPCRALFATHVDTSTGVRIDPEPLARLAREHGMIAVFDGVCAAAGERFDMAAWDADVYLTASQKALGLPPGLALMVVSRRALAARAARSGTPPPMYLDWEAWQPVMRAYEERRAAYFSTPPTNLVLALAAGLAEIESEGAAARIASHARAAAALRAAWRVLGLRLLPAREDLVADTLSALLLPTATTEARSQAPERPGGAAIAGGGAEPLSAGSARADAPAVVARIAQHGVTVATGLLPDLRNRYFRVGHMGWVVGRPDLLRRTVAAVAAGLRECGLGAGEQAERQALAALDQLPAKEAPVAAAAASP
ncbi:MAG TPA: aminotransferase class V-fold PLP-dependent enzyme [Thermoanaerobaculia bacterium]|jgi:alanine-glyoxylate transaminase/serine-glyoxylate transaminase/serine-pyruvate transaminase|nr:aminotransferase class V-fold PLP-dependent enzyme [Thermoanaerobaculia bacterium]